MTEVGTLLESSGAVLIVIGFLAMAVAVTLVMTAAASGR